MAPIASVAAANAKAPRVPLATVVPSASVLRPAQARLLLASAEAPRDRLARAGQTANAHLLESRATVAPDASAILTTASVSSINPICSVYYHLIRSLPRPHFPFHSSPSHFVPFQFPLHWLTWTAVEEKLYLAEPSFEHQ